jgi:hypothetical protein
MGGFLFEGHLEDFVHAHCLHEIRSLCLNIMYFEVKFDKVIFAF